MSILYHTEPGLHDLPDATRCHCPNPPTPSDVIDWTSASHYLNHGQWLYARTLANNTRLLRLVDGDVALRLHSSEIVVYPHPSKELTVEARFSLAGYPTKTTARRIIEHTGVLNIGLIGGKPSVLSRSYVLGDKTMWMGCADNEVMAVTGAGHVVLDVPEPMTAHDFHPKAKRPYRTRSKRGGKKQTVAHFTSGGQGEGQGWGQLLQSQIISTETAYAIVYGGANGSADSNPPSPFPSSPQVDPPSSPQVDGETVRFQLSQAVPDMGVKVFCPVDVSEVTGGECYAPFSLTTLLIHLNDNHHWTREAIADWLEAQDLDLEFRPLPDHSPPTTYTPF